MKPSTVETLIWVLIYGGLLVLGLGLAAQRSDGQLGYALMFGGTLAAAAGFVLIYVRSRMKQTPLLNKTSPSKDTPP